MSPQRSSIPRYVPWLNRILYVLHASILAHMLTTAQDPFFVSEPVLDKRGQPTGKVKKVKKGIPRGVSDHDAAVLKSVRRRAYKLDLSLFSLFGITFGWSAIIGIIPGVGDVIDALMAWFLVVRKCNQIDGGLPPTLHSRMVFNIILDFGIGLVPFLGDIADAWFKANTRNAWLLEDFLVKKAELRRTGAIDNPAAAAAQLDEPLPKGAKNSRPDDVEMGVTDARG